MTFSLSRGADQTMFLDPAIRNWVLFPIMAVMILVGIFRNQIAILMADDPKPVPPKAAREAKALLRGQILLRNSRHIPLHAFQGRRSMLAESFKEGKYLKNPTEKQAVETGEAPPNPLTDPQGMEAMTNMAKQNMMGMVPQMLIMGWINFFFSGFVLIKLPFPLTIRFKSMLQSGIGTPFMDVTWVSSLSWYFLNLFGLRGVFTLLLGEDNAADGMRDMQAMNAIGAPNPAQMTPGQGQEMHKSFLAESENLQLAVHEWDLANVENRLLAKHGYISKEALLADSPAAATAAAGGKSKTASKSSSTGSPLMVGGRRVVRK
ncbi:DUF850-domain-containing protein [Ramicandelaber brevisporus]|nr:DUF850-domain-containing protein [Ramicandelaber brevisporus]